MAISKIPDAEAAGAAAAASEPIAVRGARVHNLKGIDVDIPANRLVVITGVSGSGKSSLAFDTLYAEGQRRYVESLSAYARQFLERMDKPDVDEVRGVCPAVAIQQKPPPRNSRSTVGTATEVYDYLRLIFARAGTTYCPDCGDAVRRDSPSEAVDRLLEEASGRRALVAFPTRLPDTVDQRVERFKGLLKEGFRRLVVDGERLELSLRKVPELARELGGRRIQVVVDRLTLGYEERDRLLDSMEIAFREGDGRATALLAPGPETGDAGESAHRFDDRFRCSSCDRDFLRPEPRLFSFNNPFGACPECKGFGNTIEIDLDKVVPDKTLSLSEGAIEPWTKESRGRWRRRLEEFCGDEGIPADRAWAELDPDQRSRVLEGGDGFPGVLGFFARLRRKKYKLHVRVLLSRYRGYVTCPECRGGRLRREAAFVRVGGRTLPEVVALSIVAAEEFFRDLRLPVTEATIAASVLEEIRSRLRYLVDVGLGYLTLDRLTGTLSGGEAQRINLATCLGSALVGSLYVLDEPSIGLHPRDGDRLIAILERLRDQGSTLLVVEHDRQMIEVADHVIDLGPGAGVNGGELVFSGPPEELPAAERSITGAYLRGDRRLSVPPRRRRRRGEITVRGAREHNLADLDVTIPLGVLCCVTGVSGSGKSTLVHEVLYAALRQRLGAWKHGVGDHDRLEGSEAIEQVVLMDQSPIGRSSRSNPVTYVKAFDGIRKAFAETRESRARGYEPGHFSFNVSGGRCEVCEGNGEIEVEMQFLADVHLPCEECDGTRFQREIREITYRRRNIHDVLQMTVAEARRFFSDLSAVADRLKVLEDVGLGYLRLGQPSSTLSGGEAQRVKLASYLIQGGGERTLYLFDEPTTGLHFDDIAKLLFALNRLIDAGASVVVIEHNLELLKTADWIIDLGPGGGEAGGRLVAEGTPEEVARCTGSHTGSFLRGVLELDVTSDGTSSRQDSEGR